MQGQRYGVVHETVPASVLPSRGALTILRQSFVLRSVKIASAVPARRDGQEASNVWCG
jgi:hypothetical protein